MVFVEVDARDPIRGVTRLVPVVRQCEQLAPGIEREALVAVAIVSSPIFKPEFRFHRSSKSRSAWQGSGSL